MERGWAELVQAILRTGREFWALCSEAERKAANCPAWTIGRELAGVTGWIHKLATRKAVPREGTPQPSHRARADAVSAERRVCRSADPNRRDSSPGEGGSGFQEARRFSKGSVEFMGIQEVRGGQTSAQFL